MNKVTICTIYGQIEEAVARAMVTEGKLKQLPLPAVLASWLISEDGRPLLLAVVVPRKYAGEFKRRKRELKQ